MPGEHRLNFDHAQIALTLFFGDAADLLLQDVLTVRADALFLDGFSPAKNPELWSPLLLKRLGQLTVPGATLATWTVAGAVRAGLAAAGFELAKTTGYGDKREMLRGEYRGLPALR